MTQCTSSRWRAREARRGLRRRGSGPRGDPRRRTRRALSGLAAPWVTTAVVRTSPSGRMPRWLAKGADPPVFSEAERFPGSPPTNASPSLAPAHRRASAGSSGSRRPAATVWATARSPSSSARWNPTRRTPTWAAGWKLIHRAPRCTTTSKGYRTRHNRTTRRRRLARSPTRRGSTTTQAARARVRLSVPSCSSGTTLGTFRWICLCGPRMRRRRCRSFPSPRCWSAGGGTPGRASRRRCARSTRRR